MNLSSSPFVVYSIVYGICACLASSLHFLLLSWISSPLYRFYLIDFLLTCLLFLIGNYLFLSNNIYDFHWPLLPFVSSIYFLSNFSWKSVFLIVIISIWSIHLIWQNISSMTDVRHEDWRYQMMRRDYGKCFPLFAFFALHLLPMFEVLLGSSSIYYIYLHAPMEQNLTIKDLICLAIIFTGVLIENLADRQLNEFRRKKCQSRQIRFAVLSDGLWKYTRHPNYLGEMMFWWGLFLLGCLSHAPIWCGLGPLFITLMMYFGSIPMSEERLYRKYPDYKFVQQDIPKLIPTFGLFHSM